MRKFTVENFVKRAKEVHGDKYDYSKVEYVNNRTKVCIICPEHGEFWQTPNSHLDGQGCKKCGIIKRSLTKTNTTDRFIEKARKIHGNKYDYSKVEYKKATIKVCIICPEHGEFWQKPSQHLSGYGCMECGKKTCHDKRLLKQDEVIERFKNIHENTYDYTHVQYNGMGKKVCIICPEHGEFWQTPHNHLKGNGCPKCRNSYLEVFIEKTLKEEEINFIEKYRVFWLGKQHLDFYLPDYKIAIECQGEQHFSKYRFEKDDSGLLKRKGRDALKKELCEKHKIKLIYFSNTIAQTKCLEQKIIKNKKDLLEEIYG